MYPVLWSMLINLFSIGKNMKKIYGLLFVAINFLLFAAPLFASEGAVVGALSDAYKSMGAAIGAGLAIGLAALGGSLGQGKAVYSALEGISRNPGAGDKVFVPMIIGLALIESLVIYALLIAFMLLGKI